jgi:hypothetical protein
MQFWARVLVSLVAILLMFVIAQWYNQSESGKSAPDAFHANVGALEEARAQYELGLRTGTFGPHPIPAPNPNSPHPIPAPDPYGPHPPPPNSPHPIPAPYPYGPGCPRSAASVETQGLQRAGGLAFGAPYYTNESPPTVDYLTDSGPIVTDQHDDRSVDSFGARRLVRDNAQFGSILSRRNAVINSSDAQISAREARSNSARDGFGEYPTAAWAGNEGTQSPKTPASAHSCVDNCVGDLCAAHCAM